MKVTELFDASALRAVAFDEDGAEQVMMVMSRPHLGNAVTNLTDGELHAQTRVVRHRS